MTPERQAELSTKLERALSDIFLLGTVEQVRLAKEFGEDLVRGEGNAMPLLVELRGDLRKRLGLLRLEDDPWQLRIPKS